MDYDKKIDNWSLGILLYNLVTGKMPFAGKTAKKIDKYTLNNEPSFKEKAWKQCSPDVKDLCEGLLQKEPTERMTIEEVLKHPWL